MNVHSKYVYNTDIEFVIIISHNRQICLLKNICQLLYEDLFEKFPAYLQQAIFPH